MPDLDSPPHPLESKVKVPSLLAFVLAVFGLLAAFGLDLTQDQQAAILGVIVAAVPLVVFVAGFLAKHTPRPDLLDQGEILTPDGPMTFGRFQESPAVPGAPGTYREPSRNVNASAGGLIRGDSVVGPKRRGDDGMTDAGWIGLVALVLAVAALLLIL